MTKININEFIESLDSYAVSCRRFCRDTIYSYDKLTEFTKKCLSFYEQKKTHVEMAKEMLLEDSVVAFLIKLIQENTDSLFVVKDFALADKFKAVDWNEFIVETQKTLYVNIMFDDTDEDSENDWSWADSFITTNLPVELPKEYANNIHNLDLGEDGSWGNYLKLEKFGNKHDVVVSTLEEKQELIEMYRLMNKYLG